MDDEVANYLFYFSVENEVCRGWFTEKLWRCFYYGVVPIVLYPFDDIQSLVPKNSYINVLDFSTADELAKYLQFLSQNKTAYDEYFVWRNDPHEVAKLFTSPHHYDNLCDIKWEKPGCEGNFIDWGCIGWDEILEQINLTD